MYNISIVATKSKSTEQIVDQLNQAGLDRVTLFQDYLEFINKINSSTFDLILVILDKNNSFINKAVQFLHHECQDIPYIFCIENEKNAIVGKLTKYLPSGLLYAPFTSVHLSNIIEITMDCVHKKKFKNGHRVPGNEALSSGQKQDKHAFFKSGTEIIKVSYDEIKHIYSEHVYVFIVTDDKKIPLRTKLESLEGYLPQPPFQRIHQRFIVNIEHITKLNTDVVFLDDTELPLSKKYKKQLLSKMNVFC